ncbi:MAG: hypothetical protein PHO20_05775, partial [Candidatus Peribacteraceae bacterium]|nr:hypothetical protein [Candidatus Peribacteraceae bacterium]
GNYTLSVSSAYQQSGGTFAGGGAAITVTGTFTLSGGAFTSTSTTLTLYGSWAHTDGTFTHNSGAVLIDRLSPGSANTIDVPTTATFYTLTIQGHDNVTTISGGDTLVVLGTLTLGSVSPSFPLYGLNGGTVEVRGNMVVNAAMRGGSTTYSYLVGGDQTITGGGNIGPLTVAKSSGTLSVSGNLGAGAFTLSGGTFASTTGTFSIYGNWTHTAGGTFNHNYGTVLIDRATPGSSDTIDVTGTETFNNLTIRGHDSYRTIAAGDTLIALGTFALGHTEMSYPLYGMNGGTIEARGNVVMNVRSADGSTALSFTGTGAQTYTDLGGLEPDGTITVNKPSGTVTLASNADWNASGQDLTITSGTLNIAGYTLAVADQFTIGASGTLKLQGAETVSAIDSNAGTVEFTGNGNAGENTYTVTALATSYQNLTVNSTDGTTDTFQLGAALDVNGDFTIKAGAFVAGSGITLAGDWIKKAASTFAHGDGTVTLDGTSQTMSGSTTFYDFSKTVASADTLTWESGSTQTIAAGGSITLNGAEDNLLTLAPSVAESAWNLDVDATASQSVSYVSVSYSDASGGAEIDASDGTNTDGGGTTNWNFEGAAPAKKNYFWFF